MRLEYRPHGEGDAGGATLRRQPSASMLPVRTRYFQPRRAGMKGTSDRWLEPPFFSPASWAPAGPCLAEPRGLAGKRLVAARCPPAAGGDGMGGTCAPPG
jgi:hypothetical protein